MAALDGSDGRRRPCSACRNAVVARFAQSHGQVRALIAGSGDDLFDKRVVRWTGSTSVGAYAVSATSSHYAWALDLVRRFRMGSEPSGDG